MTEIPTKLEHLRHSTAHLLAAAVLKLYPSAKPTIGPATNEGFYYDFDLVEPVSEDDLKKIEKTMKKLVNSWKSFERSEVSVEKARERFHDNPYKLELIEEISTKGEPITLYTSGEFTDLCRGGHIDDPYKTLKAFKLLTVSGAYWRGDEKNTMLTRISGTAFPSKEELNEYLMLREEAKKRDHRRLGQQLDLFTFSELVGSGLPLFTPKGTIIRQKLQDALMSISEKYGYQQVTIPHIAKLALYETSGHAQKFENELFRVQSHYNQEFVMKPVNCPHHTQIFASQQRSYRDMPIRYIESTMQYRDEKPGEIGGLTRVRAITCDDGHTFCRVSQIKEEVINLCSIIREFYTALGMYGNHWVSLSVRDYTSQEKYIGNVEDWEQAESMLQEISDELGLDAKKIEGEAAIYGPKLDFMFKDALGNERQLSTVQLDFAMPKRFGLSYINEEGENETPVMIHRAILGSYERFLAILIEHFAGAFPLWLAPVQVCVIPVSDKHTSYAKKVNDYLKNNGIRTELLADQKTVSYKIRQSTLQKVPYMGIIGDTEVDSSNNDNLPVSVRTREGDDLGVMSVDSLLQKLLRHIENVQ
ncbi:MAG: threonine--tRNA ligase [Patescibacteria group bacterium]